MTNLNSKNLESVLLLLSERLALVMPGQRWDLVVCGGSALNALNLVSRTTKDIDVIGKMVNNKVCFASFDDLFKEQIIICSELLNLPVDWLNTGPESYLKTGLPSGLVGRLTWRQYGHCLRIGYISRIDQVFFKIYASVDRGGYHVDDLLALKPKSGELLDACKWVLEQDPSEGFRSLLLSMLHQLEFNDVASKI